MINTTLVALLSPPASPRMSHDIEKSWQPFSNSPTLSAYYAGGAVAGHAGLGIYASRPQEGSSGIQFQPISLSSTTGAYTLGPPTPLISKTDPLDMGTSLNLPRGQPSRAQSPRLTNNINAAPCIIDDSVVVRPAKRWRPDSSEDMIEENDIRSDTFLDDAPESDKDESKLRPTGGAEPRTESRKAKRFRQVGVRRVHAPSSRADAGEDSHATRHGS